MPTTEPRGTIIEARTPRAHAPQQEKLQQWEARTEQLEKARGQERRLNEAKNK